jgi:hypothetical protein
MCVPPMMICASSDKNPPISIGRNGRDRSLTCISGQPILRPLAPWLFRTLTQRLDLSGHARLSFIWELSTWNKAIGSKRSVALRRRLTRVPKPHRAWSCESGIDTAPVDPIGIVAQLLQRRQGKARGYTCFRTMHNRDPSRTAQLRDQPLCRGLIHSRFERAPFFILGSRATAVLLALAGFVSVVLIPDLKCAAGACAAGALL